MVNTFEAITEIVQVIQARPNKKNNAYYKALKAKDGVNGIIPLVRISNKMAERKALEDDLSGLGPVMPYPANHIISIVIEDKPSSCTNTIPNVHEYVYRQDDLNDTDIQPLIRAIRAVFTDGEFADPIGKAEYNNNISK